MLAGGHGAVTPTCASLGCANRKVEGVACQCHPHCVAQSDCCNDFEAVCNTNITEAAWPAYDAHVAYNVTDMRVARNGTIKVEKVGRSKASKAGTAS